MNTYNKIIKIAGLALLVFVTLSACKKDSTTTVIPPDVILDGYYVTGAVTPFSSTLVTKGMMKKARNEVTQTDRASLYELYISLKAGATGFSIVKVAGSVQSTYGPATTMDVITTGTTDEPKLPFQRGAIAENSIKFTVPSDGMYHVVIDVGLMKAVIVPVHWGIIGAATPNGWGGSMALTESSFNQTTMTWTISNLELRGGDWKFRYSDGWKVELDTVLDLGGGQKGVKINTNFGGAVNALVAGGANFVNAAPGLYTLSLVYTLGTGYVATATKTGDLPLTNWTGVKCDAVGDGVSADNSAAIPDPSTWNWGRVLLADNGGIPTKVGDIYTWKWTNIVIEAAMGFKVRTLNGVAPPIGGANFDAGFSSVNVASSSPKVVDMSGNLSVTTKGPFTITLEIDAANSDAKKIIITE